MNKLSIYICCALTCSFNLLTHETIKGLSEFRPLNRAIVFPDVQDRKTIIADLHTHSVFSDGHVWPNIRVAEAEKDGLDLLAITEHIEYQPHFDHIPHPDRNAAYREAKKSLNSDLLVINGAEITREMPPGHMNAIFIKDANKLLNLDQSLIDEAKEKVKKRIDELSKDEIPIAERYALANLWPVEKALLEAKLQGAFVFWNHPMWDFQNSDGIPKLLDMHHDFISRKLLHGVEIVNTQTYSEEAFNIALENNLTIIGTSDVHNLIEWDYQSHQNEHRPVTLIFAKQNSPGSIKEALFNRRTVVFYKGKLIGENKNLEPLLNAIIQIQALGYKENTSILKIKVENNSSVDMFLKNRTDFTFHNNEGTIKVPSNDEVIVEIKTKKNLEHIDLNFEIINALKSPNEHPLIQFNIKV